MNNKKTPFWFWIIAAFGLLWNGSGVVQFILNLDADIEKLVSQGLSD